MTDLVFDVIHGVLGNDATAPHGTVTACEDFAFFQEMVPGAPAFVGIANEACGACCAQRHDRRNVDESTLMGGVADDEKLPRILRHYRVRPKTNRRQAFYWESD